MIQSSRRFASVSLSCKETGDAKQADGSLAQAANVETACRQVVLDLRESFLIQQLD
jgi:hypothetical protein